MIYLQKPHLVLLRVPKTGTHAWRDALKDHTSFIIDEPPNEKHLVLDQYLAHFHKLLTRERGTAPEVVICFREPLDWVNSWYRYRYLPRSSPYADGRPLTRSSFGLSFDAFLGHYIAQSGHPAVDIGHQSSFLKTKHQTPRLHLFQYEQLDQMRRFLEERLGARLSLPQINVGQSGDRAVSATREAAFRAFAKEDYKAWASAFCG